VHRRRSRRGAAASRGALFTWVAPAAPGRRRTAAPDAQPPPLRQVADAQPLPTHSRSRRTAAPDARPVPTPGQSNRRQRYSSLRDQQLLRDPARAKKLA